MGINQGGGPSFLPLMEEKKQKKIKAPEASTILAGYTDEIRF